MIYIISTIIVLAVLIFVHEFGHFLMAKLFNVYVLEFSLGFGPKLFSFKKNETEYKVSAIPFGGYVKLLGEDDDDIPEGLEKYAFSNKSTFQKIMIIFGGPLFNFIFAALFFAIVFLKGVAILQPFIGDVQKNMPAYSAGLKKGDKIIQINNFIIKKWDDIPKAIKKNKGEILEIKVLRKNKILTFRIKPVVKEYKNIFGESKKRYFIGIVADTSKVKIIHLNPFQAIVKGVEETYRWIKLTILSIIKLIERIVPFSSLGGPILIGQIAGETAKQGIFNFLYFLAVISVNLGVLNLVPFPVLDGGRIVILLLEKIRGKEFDIKKMELIQKIGFSILIALMFFVFYNDILRILNK